MHRLLPLLSLSLSLLPLLPPTLAITIPIPPQTPTSFLPPPLPLPPNTTSLTPHALAPRAAYACSASYFAPDQFDASGAGEWYVDWTASIDKAGDAWRHRHSEADFFARHWLGVDDFRCAPDVSHPGCAGMPSCEDVVRFHGGRADVARKALFIARSWHHANLWAGEIRRATYGLEIQARDIMDDLWADFWHGGKPFFWDSNIDTQCRYLHGFATKLILEIHNVLMTMIPLLDPKDGDATSWAGELDAALSRAPFLWKMKNRDGTFWPHRKEPVNPQVSAFILSRPPYNGTIDLGIRVNSRCVFGPYNYDRPDRPKEFVHWYFDDYRRGVDRMHALNHGVGFGWEGKFEKGDASFMAEQFRFGHFAKVTELEEKWFKPEHRDVVDRDAWNRMKIGLITVMHDVQGCYLHCVPNPGEAPWLPPEQCDNANYGSRLCPNKHTVCQAQCWRDQGDFSTPIRLYGRDVLADPNNKYGIDLNEYLRHSYHHYLKYHHRDGPSWLALDAGAHEDRHFGAHMPTCYTEFSRLVDTFVYSAGDEPQHGAHGKALDHGRNQAYRLPCTCGNIWGNETASFFYDSGLSLNSEPYGWGDRCTRNMDDSRTPAVSEFLTMCNLGYMWPYNDQDGYNRIWHQRDPHCDSMVDTMRRYEIYGVRARDAWPAKKVTSSTELFCRICFESTVGRKIAAAQSPWVMKAQTEQREMKYTFVMGCDQLDRLVCRDSGVLTPDLGHRWYIPHTWPVIDPLNADGVEYTMPTPPQR